MRSSSRFKALVAAWFDFLDEDQRAVAEQLQAAIRAAAPTSVEAVQWGNLMFIVDEIKLVAIEPHKAHVQLQIFNGSQLPADQVALDGIGRGARHLRCRLNQPVDAGLVERLVGASLALAREQARSNPRRRPPQEG